MNFRKLNILCVLFFLMEGALFAQSVQPRSVRVVDTPTAYTIERGAYDISFFAYDNGGMEFKSFIGLHDAIFFGVSFDVQNLLGSATPYPNIPGVVAKFKLFEGMSYLPAIAVGYDSFYEATHDTIDHPYSLNHKVKYGAYSFLISPLYYFYQKNRGIYRRKNRFNRMIYGPYIALTSPVYLLGGEQFISYGVRVPIQPYVEPEKSSYFFAVDIPLGEFFRIRSELERVFWNFRSPREWVVNTGVRFTYFEQLSIEFFVGYEPGEDVTRSLRIEYNGEF